MGHTAFNLYCPTVVQVVFLVARVTEGNPVEGQHGRRQLGALGELKHERVLPELGLLDVAVKAKFEKAKFETRTCMPDLSRIASAGCFSLLVCDSGLISHLYVQGVETRRVQAMLNWIQRIRSPTSTASDLILLSTLSLDAADLALPLAWLASM
jgi:hypothetical protein